MTCSNALDWRKQKPERVFLIVVQLGDNDQRGVESFSEPIADLCHNSPSSPTQIGALMCALQAKKWPMLHTGTELCHNRHSTHHDLARRNFHKLTAWHRRVTHIVGPVCVNPFCSAVMQHLAKFLMFWHHTQVWSFFSGKCVSSVFSHCSSMRHWLKDAIALS